MRYFAGIEAGGTKFVCVISNEEGKIIEKSIISTETPEITLPRVIQFFKSFSNQLTSMGIGAFGPVDLHPSSPHYGKITHTPKLAWRNFNLLQALQSEFNIPMVFDTDVNAAALGEYTWGAAQNISHFLYITVGTGIGVGGMINHELMHGLTHPEMGHILIPGSSQDISNFKGICPYHGNCLEGLASGTALNARWGVSSSQNLEKNHIAWEIESDHLAQALMNYTLICSPQKIIMGGGVMHQQQLFPMIQKKLKALLNGYVQHPTILENIVSPKLKDNAGSLGAIALAMKTKS